MARKEKKKKIVLASGVFDLLHPGHVWFLEQAKRAGGSNAELIVIVARDLTVKRRKGEWPIIHEAQRRVLVEALKIVDEAVLGFAEFDIGKVIETIKPDVVAVGYDQEGMEKTVKDYVDTHALKIKVVRISKFSENGLDSSSKIKQRIIEDYKR